VPENELGMIPKVEAKIFHPKVPKEEVPQKEIDQIASFLDFTDTATWAVTNIFKRGIPIEQLPTKLIYSELLETAAISCFAQGAISLDIKEMMENFSHFVGYTPDTPKRRKGNHD
jgi:hypothetical protein